MRGDPWQNLDVALLRAWALPEIAPEADKEMRGRVLVIAGSREVPGAALLAGVAALRAGAGKLALATAQSVAPQLAIAVPEARVIALPETARGGFALQGLDAVRDCAKRADAVLIGPGMMDEDGTSAFVRELLPLLAHVPVVLDALAMNAAKAAGRFSQPVLLTPHAGEMAHLLETGKDAVTADAGQTVAAAADKYNCIVALKGAVTLIAAPGGGRWRHDGGQPGLATSGSGDVLAGLIAGLAAQQAALEQACAWGVALHGLAGARLAARLGPLGFLARELPGEVPALLKKLRRGGRLRPSGFPSRE
jgi:hydroxyethylthiazole kinase-like uncharacterized protein yjeF